jgi:hypothetical protein
MVRSFLAGKRWTKMSVKTAGFSLLSSLNRSLICWKHAETASFKG